MDAKQIGVRAAEFLTAKTSKVKLLQMMNREENQDLLVAIMTELRDNSDLSKTVSRRMVLLKEENALKG